MSEDREYSPWFEHDGAKPEVWKDWNGQHWSLVHLAIQDRDWHLKLPDAPVDRSWPGFYWRWRPVKTGFFARALYPVCDDPSYAPVIRYRFSRLRPPAASVARLAEIVADPSLPVTGPEGPIRVPGNPVGGAA